MDVKKESLKELRNKILRLFGESLDDYEEERVRCVQAINLLAESKSKLSSEVNKLSRDKVELTSTVLEMEKRKKDVEVELGEKSGKLEKYRSNILANIEADKLRHQARLDKLYKEYELKSENIETKAKEVANLESLAKSKLEVITQTEKSLEERQANNAKLSEQLANKENELKNQEIKAYDEIKRAGDIVEKALVLSRKEADLDKKQAEIEEKNRLLEAKIEKYNLLERTLDQRASSLDAMQTDLHKKEVWLDDRIKTMKSHDV